MKLNIFTYVAPVYVDKYIANTKKLMTQMY